MDLLVFPEAHSFQTHLDSMSSMISGDLWMEQLSMTMTDFGAGNGCIFRRRSLMKAMNNSALKEPSMIVHSIMPSRVIAGKIEYL